MAREQSLENHLSLASLRAGHASVDVMARLFNAIGTARCLHEADHGRDAAERADFDRAWQVLLERSRNGRNASLVVTEEDFRLLARLVSLHDEQMTITPLHRLLAARMRFNESLRQTLKPAPPAADEAGAPDTAG
ncbi:hypothetical protein AAGS40_29870 (plasmid) [Paraburkholderia sp. PREW-6R]|uniref:hypothetical protein n=1 Tax=Paraburkholderia sp. PREW-6R TaxID=3141544 RepID=UPI0031F5778A